jgi:hypothetical protein
VGGTRATATLQRLRLEVEPTFLLDVGRVFAPSLAGGGGEAPEEVLPRDVRLEPGVALRLEGDVTLGRARRMLADGVRGGEYELDGGGFTVTVGDEAVAASERLRKRLMDSPTARDCPVAPYAFDVVTGSDEGRKGR